MSTVLITGATSGIGYELARCFARDRYHVVLVARSPEALRQKAHALQERFGVTTTVIANDLSRPEAPEELVGELQRQQLHVDALVNNAGVGAYGPFAEIDLSTELAMVQVNLVSLTHLTKRLLPPMLARRCGKILNVASTAAFQPGPLMAVYYATKAYVLSLSEALANELRGTGVSVTVLCPGPVPTNFQQRAGMTASRLMSGAVMDAATVAEAGYRGLMRNRTVVIPGWSNRLLTLAVRGLPRRTVTRAVRFIQERRQQT